APFPRPSSCLQYRRARPPTGRAALWSSLRVAGESCPRGAASADAACPDLGDPSSDEGGANVAALARWCYRPPLVGRRLWVGARCGLAVSASSAGTTYANVFSLPDTDSKRAYDLLEKAFPERAGDTDTVVWKVDEGSVRDDAVRSRIEPALREISGMEGVGAVTGATAAQGRTQIAGDG